MIISRTPFRVSFFGGGSDYPQWYRQHGGAVLATAIDKYCYISCRRLPPFFDYKHRLVYRKQEMVNQISEIEHPAVCGVFSHFEWDEGFEILPTNRPITDFGALLHEAWSTKRKLSDAVSTDAIDRIYADARDAGAVGGKLLGAGGGGFMLLFVPPAKQDSVRKRLDK